MSAFDRLSRSCGPVPPPELLADIAAFRAEVRAETQAEDHAAITEVMAAVHDVVTPPEKEALRQAAEAIASGGTGIEYGVAVQPHRLGVGRVLDPTPNRGEAERRLVRYSDMGVTRLVQRTVHHDEWTEVAS